MTETEIENLFENTGTDENLILLSSFGHCLTICAREAYETNGVTVQNPVLLRETNEILHRVFLAIGSFAKRKETDLNLPHWISGKGASDETQRACRNALKLAIERNNS